MMADLAQKRAFDLQCIVTLEPGLAEIAVPISWLALEDHQLLAMWLWRSVKLHIHWRVLATMHHWPVDLAHPALPSATEMASA